MQESDMFIYLSGNFLHCKLCNEELHKNKMEFHIRENHMNER